MHHILCGSPFISRDFYAIRPLSLWHILGSYFLLIWGVGVVRIIFTLCHSRSVCKRHAARAVWNSDRFGVEVVLEVMLWWLGRFIWRYSRKSDDWKVMCCIDKESSTRFRICVPHAFLGQSLLLLQGVFTFFAWSKQPVDQYGASAMYEPTSDIFSIWNLLSLRSPLCLLAHNTNWIYIGSRCHWPSSQGCCDMICWCPIFLSHCRRCNDKNSQRISLIGQQLRDSMHR